MKFYELPQATQDMLVERQRDYVTSCMDWLEDLFPLINDRVNEEYGRIFTEPFDALMNIQEFEWPHNIVWSTTYTELDLAVFSEALGVFVPSYNARLEVSPNGRVWLFFGEYQADSSWREFEDACTKILAEVKDVILDIVSEYYEEVTSTAYIESQLWDEDFKSNGDFAWEPPVLTDKELADHLFKTGTEETTTGNKFQQACVVCGEHFDLTLSRLASPSVTKAFVSNQPRGKYKVVWEDGDYAYYKTKRKWIVKDLLAHGGSRVYKLTTGETLKASLIVRED